MDLAEDYTVFVCRSCSVTFAMTNVLARLRANDHKSFWCPNGHTLEFEKDSTSNEDMKKENTKLKIRVSHLEDQLQAAKEEK